MYFIFFFFFSSRRRHTRWTGDWSSDVCSSDLKRRARELRALGERKAAAFRQSQAGRELRVLTLHPSGDSSNNRTPALSSNYLRLFVDGIFPANQWLDVKLAGCEGTFLTGRVSGLGF